MQIAGALLGGAFVAAIGCGSAVADELGGYYYTDPSTGLTMYAQPDGQNDFVDPATGYVLDTVTGDYIDPTTGLLYTVDPTTGGMVTAITNGNIAGDTTIEVDDPTTLHIGTGTGSGATCPMGATGSSPCGYAYTAGSQLIATMPYDTIDIYQNTSTQNPAGKTLAEIGLIVLVPNNEAYSGSLSNAMLYNPYNESYPNSVSINSWYIGTYSGSTYSDVYDYALATMNYPTGTYADATGTSLTNLKTAVNGVNTQDQMGLSSVSSFGVYVYALSTSVFGPNNAINVDTSALPAGSVILAVGDTQTTTKNWNWWGYSYTTTYTYYTTPLTQGGIVAYFLPEPGSLGLMVSSLAGFGFVAWRRRRDQPNGEPADACGPIEDETPA